MKRAALAASLIAATLATACAPGSRHTGFTPESSLFGDSRVNPSGANHIIDDKAAVITEGALARMMCGSGQGSPRTLFDGLQCMSSDGSTASEADYLRRRNNVQHYLMFVSDQRCSLWMTYLLRAGAINRGSFSVLSTVTGGLAPLFGTGAAKALGATSGMLSGTGAAIDAAMLHGLTEGVVIPGVLRARKDVREQIKSRQEFSSSLYPVTAALEDAILYHGSCSMASVLQPESRQEVKSYLNAPVHAVAGDDIRPGTRIIADGHTFFIVNVTRSPIAAEAGDPDKQEVTYVVTPAAAKYPGREKFAAFRDGTVKGGTVY